MLNVLAHRRKVFAQSPQVRTMFMNRSGLEVNVTSMMNMLNEACGEVGHTGSGRVKLIVKSIISYNEGSGWVVSWIASRYQSMGNAILIYPTGKTDAKQESRKTTDAISRTSQK